MKLHEFGIYIKRMSIKDDIMHECLSYRRKESKHLLYLFLLMTGIFVSLYYPFLFGGKMYAYDDVGGDTIHQYLPMMNFELKQLIQGKTDGYTLNYGLGAYLSGTLLKYLDPGMLPLVLLGTENLHWGILLATYVRYLMICGFGLLFFLRVLHNHRAAAVCALLWTFCGYNVLWGQHYGFLSAMAAFTVCLYGFQLFLDEDPKQWITVLTTAYLAAISYFFMYSACFYLLVYGFIYLRCKGCGLWRIVKRAGLFLLSMIPAICIALPLLLPGLLGFFESARTSQVTSLLWSLETSLYSWTTILEFLARWLSNDLIGVGNNFKGLNNYYECAQLNVSLLFVFGFAYLLQSHYWKLLLSITIPATLLLCMPVTSKILVFSDITQRWSYMLSIAQVLVVGFALVEFLRDRTTGSVGKKGIIAVAMGDGILVLVAIVLLLYDRVYYPGWLNKEACIKLAVLLVLYHLGFVVLWKGKMAYPILVTLIAVELVTANYACIHDRNTIMVEQWYEDMYNDGTAEAIAWIQEQDDSLYRINKTYASVYSIANNDPLVQGFNGLSVYTSVTSANLLNLYDSYGYPITGNWLWFRGTDSRANNMLGVKYLLSNGNCYIDQEQYQLLYDTGQYQIYENKYWAGFGYLYEEELPVSSFLGASQYEQELLFSKSYYRTDAEPTATSEETTKGIAYMDLIPLLEDYYDCIVKLGDTGWRLGTGEDCQLYFSLPKLEEGWGIAGIEVVIETEASSSMEVYGDLETNQPVATSNYSSGSSTLMLDWAEEYTGQLRWDPANNEQWITVRSLKLVLLDKALLRESLFQLQDTAVTDLMQDGNTFTGTVNNSGNSTKMLCVPLIFSEFWSVILDGSSVNSVNINGGLLGIEIPPGIHTIEIHYNTVIYSIGVVLCAVVLPGYLLGVWLYKNRLNSGRKYHD